jgi:hypothetical protein
VLSVRQTLISYTAHILDRISASGLSHKGRNIGWVIENGVLNKIFSPKINEVRGGRRKLHNEEHNDLYSSPDSIRVITHGSWDGWGI